VILRDLTGGRFLVTGTANGIGRATARALLDQGAQVEGLDRSLADLGPRYRHVPCDLANAEQIAAAVDDLAHRGEALDGLVNVAGIDPKIPLAEADLEAWQRVIDLDLRAYFLLIHHSLPLLRAGRGRAIVNVSSINYRLGVPKRALYSAAKAGILGLTTGLARELGAEGIRINTVSPGWVFTDRQVAEYFQHDPAGEANLAYLYERQSLRYDIQPEDVANHILFYLSEASRASTGHNCIVDAGWLLE
jgi:NAD(P)-dependent dehydrogenase (short-subunit alcohol dehydrogenase family)